MRPLEAACTMLLAALALPMAVFAQSPMAVPLNPGRPPYIRPPYTPKPTRPVPPDRRPGYHPPGYRPGNNGHYPLIIDGSVVNRYLATPGPALTSKPTHRPSNGQDQFETHSSTDANG